MFKRTTLYILCLCNTCHPFGLQMPSQKVLRPSSKPTPNTFSEGRYLAPDVCSLNRLKLRVKALIARIDLQQANTMSHTSPSESKRACEGLVPSHWASRAAGHTTLGRRGTGWGNNLGSSSGLVTNKGLPWITLHYSGGPPARTQIR